MSDELNTSEKVHPLTTIQKMENLAKIHIFSKLGSQELLFIANHAEEVYFEPGESIFTEGTPAYELLALVRGEVELTRSAAQSGIVHAGECVGLHSVLTNQMRLFSSTARTPCFALKITADVFWEILEEDTSFCRAIIELLVEEVNRRVADLAESTSIR